MQQSTLCFLIEKDRSQILLGRKKRGFAVNKYNGFGGKVDSNETIEEAALRELFEETCVVSSTENLQKVGKLNFYFPVNKHWNQTVHVFLIEKWQNEPMESEEMEPKWFNFDDLPFSQMWQDDLHWLPLVLKGKKVEANFYFNEDNETIKRFNIKEVTF